MKTKLKPTAKRKQIVKQKPTAKAAKPPAPPVVVKPIEVPREFTAPPKTVSADGLVHMDEDKRTRLLRVPLHYCAGKWFGPNRRGGFTSYKDSQAAALLSEYGFHRVIKNEAGTAECERALLWLMPIGARTFLSM